MFTVDDRTGNAVTTVALFVVVAAILYVARAAIFVFLLSLLFAHLLEPSVSWVQRRSPLAKGNRTYAIAQVYSVAMVAVASLVYTLGPPLTTEMAKLNAAVPHLLERLSSGQLPAGLATRHGVIEGMLARDAILHAFERAAVSAAYIAGKAIWLLAVPILAVFFLKDRCHIIEAITNLRGQRGDLVRQILQDIDAMLAKYIRAQLFLAGLSFLFYTALMLLLRFPYAVALGLLGGALEFLPAVGWIASAAAILTVGLLSGSHWVWMAVLLGVWRVVQDYVNAPRIMGRDLAIQPLTVIFALSVGGAVAGIPGMYFSVPALAVLRIVWLRCFLVRARLNTRTDQRSATPA